jgi:hypothetical protein
MAKDEKLGGLLTGRKSDRAIPSRAETDPIKPRGIGLRVSEWEQLTKIARELGMKPHALALYAVRDFIARYDRGEIETKQSKRLA